MKILTIKIDTVGTSTDIVSGEAMFDDYKTYSFFIKDKRVKFVRKSKTGEVTGTFRSEAREKALLFILRQTIKE